MKPVKICFVAAPLIARSGVFNSARELVRAGRSTGLEWNAVLGVSSAAGGTIADEQHVRELQSEPSGLGGVRALSRALLRIDEVQAADLVVSLVPQSDMALSLTRLPWVAYLRGLPWPAAGEASAAKATAWRLLELAALRRSKDVWATTPLLARESGPVVKRLVAPGIQRPTPLPEQEGSSEAFVWAARYSKDKNPLLFVDALRGSGLRGVMYGAGPLEQIVRSQAPENLSVPGWAEPGELWRGAYAYVGTSSREAFGRSAVEAAMLGIPPLISSSFGCAEMLYTDARLRAEMVLDTQDPAAWRNAMKKLHADPSLHSDARAHAAENAKNLTIESAVSNVRDATDSVLSRLASR